ncbi:MAG: extracellular solute-binding protein [Oscillospiraceae bacterium]|jgi:ABC-type glycerol-3-phosphate transport system substrate-binding protein|nr:extracellular solute-binding protein [Oscillospiraceae bacterium]
MQRKNSVLPIYLWYTCLFFLILLLTACASVGSEKQDQNVSTLIYATLSGRVNRELVDRFNAEHSGDVQIEVVDYSEGIDEGGHQGMDRLVTEIAAGKCPDIMEMFTYTTNYTGKINALPYQMLAKRGYLEDLWPYIENDPELGRTSILEAPLKAAEVDGGLYMLFNRFSIQTVAGPIEVVGDQYSWNLDELRDAFSTMPGDATVLDYCTRKSDVFLTLFPMLVDSYIDWEGGQCFFDGEGFRSSLEFINSFPLELEWTSDEAINRELCERQMNGLQMLNTFGITRARGMQEIDAWCGGRAGFVGYPTADGSVGSFFSIESERLAMSANCKNKDAAWDFLRKMLLPQYVSAEGIRIEESNYMFPVNQTDFRKHFEHEQSISYKAPVYAGLGSPIYDFPPMEEADYDRLMDFINRIDKLGIYNQKLLDIIAEPCEAYFSGDKSLDETVALIQNRVTLYVNEQK